MNDKLDGRQLCLRFDEPTADTTDSPAQRSAEVIDFVHRRAERSAQTRQEDEGGELRMIQRAIHSVRFF